MARYFTHVSNSLQPKNKLEKAVIALFYEYSNLILKTEKDTYPILFIGAIKGGVTRLNDENLRCRKVEVTWQKNNDGGLTIYTTNGFVAMQIFKSKN